MYPSRYGNMVNDYYVERYRIVQAERRERLAKLKTRADAEKYVKQVRASVRKCFPSMPKVSSLNARVTGSLEGNGFGIEKVIYESRPGFMVTGNFYLPEGASETGSEKVPCVLGLCGHDLTGRLASSYQSFAQGLAKKGFAVFIIDPISQGERKQHKASDGGKWPGLCQMHNIMGNQQVLLDDFFGTWRVWDAMRGIDYLFSRPEVDRTRVGVTGNSGGGTLTSYVTALDDRITMSAPSCYICSLTSNIEKNLPTDAEQNPPGFIKAGLDQVDLLMCCAPKPTIVLAQHYDFFEERYSVKASEELKKVHRLLGGKNTAEYFAGPTTHGYSLENREAMYEFFMKHAGVSGSAKEGKLKLFAPEELYAAPKGQTGKAGSRRVFDFTSDRVKELAEGRKKLSVETLRRTAAKLLQMPAVKSNTAPHYRALLPECVLDDVGLTRFAVETEPGIQALASVYNKAFGYRMTPGRAVLYVGHRSSRDELEKTISKKDLLRSDPYYIAVDPRGLGETSGLDIWDKDNFFQLYGVDYYAAALGEMFGESYFGRRVFDLMRVIDCIESMDIKVEKVIGHGQGSLIAAYAGLLHKNNFKVELNGYISSYETITADPLAVWPLANMVRGVLKHFDLPDVYAALGKRLSLKELWNGRMKPVKQRKAKKKASKKA